jgi:hypothetical protein
VGAVLGSLRDGCALLVGESLGIHVLLQPALHGRGAGLGAASHQPRQVPGEALLGAYQRTQAEAELALASAGAGHRRVHGFVDAQPANRPHSSSRCTRPGSGGIEQRAVAWPWRGVVRLLACGPGNRAGCLQLRDRRLECGRVQACQLGGAARQPVRAQARVTLLRRAQQRRLHGRLQSGYRRRPHAQCSPQPVGRREAQPWHITDQTVRVGRQHTRRVDPVGGQQTRGIAGVQPVLAQETGHAAQRAVLRPCRGDRARPLCSDPLHLAHTLGPFVQHLQRGLAERLDDAPRQHRPDLSDQPRPQIALDVLERRRWADLCALGTKLIPVPRVRLPVPLQEQPLTGLDGRQGANHGHWLTVAPHPQADHTEAILRVVEGHALDRALEGYLRA